MADPREQTEFVPDLPVFGRYRAVARLGAGASGTVYRAVDDVLGREVAIKVLHALGDPEAHARFLREARAVARLGHDGIVAIYDLGGDGAAPFLVMELAAGGSLRDRMRAGAVPAAAVPAIGIQIARALAVAHAAGVVHRDVKPANILAAADGRWKLADFGVARLPDSTLTTAGQFLGSPSYAAPEAIRAGVYGATSDVYGLAATLYELLAGAPPFGAHDDPAAVRRKLAGDAPPLATRAPVTRALSDAIGAALARDPAHRPGPDALARSLADAAAGR